jgi:CPA2 family monovalent cation:H+ antiporter-2
MFFSIFLERNFPCRGYLGLAGWLIPKFLYYIATLKQRELFIFSLLAVSSILAYLANWIGLSLGAFLAGLIVSESKIPA